MEALRDLLVGAGADYDEFINEHGNDVLQCLAFGNTQPLADAIVFFEPTITQPIADAIVAGEQAITEVSVTPTAANFDQILWAEESGGLTANNRQWSFGNGAVGACNLIVPNDGEITGMFLAAEAFGTSVQMELMVNNVSSESATFTTNNTNILFATPISVSAGDQVGFRTQAVVGTNNDVRVGAIYRQGVSIEGIQGPQGIEGPAGAPGIASLSSAYATVSGTQDVNSSTTPIITELTTLDGNSGPGWTLAGNEMTYTGSPQQVKMHINIGLNSTSARSVTSFDIYRNGTSLGYAPVKHTYIRNGSGDQESSANGTFIDLNPGTNPSYSVYCQRESNITTPVTADIGGLFTEAFN